MQFTVDPDRRGRLEVDGASVAWARWETEPAMSASSARAPVVLVHGASAHLGWWDAVIATLLAGGPRVPIVGLELSGHGDSEHRDDYSGTRWAAEVLAVVGAIGGGPGLLVGHSLGGRISILAAARDPRLVPRLVLVDSPVVAPVAAGERRRRVIPARLGPRTVHPTLEAAVDAFRLRPREPVADAELFARVAAGAHRRAEVGEGWVLRADLSVFNRVTDDELAVALAAAGQPITMVYGRDSAVVDTAGLEFLRATHAGETELVALDGHHHLTFDRATELAEIIAARWEREFGASRR